MIAVRLEMLLCPFSLRKRFKEILLERINESIPKYPFLLMGIQFGAWLHFDEVLGCKWFSKRGVYDCVAHYPLLVEAVKRVKHLGFCPVQSRIYIANLDLVFCDELAPFM